MTSASVFQSFVFISLLKSWSTVVGLVPSNKTRTLSFFFTSFGALEFAGEKIIHYQRRDKRRDAKILLRIVIEHMKPKLVAAARQPGKELVHSELFFVRPLTDGIQ